MIHWHMNVVGSASIPIKINPLVNSGFNVDFRWLHTVLICLNTTTTTTNQNQEISEKKKKTQLLDTLSKV